LRAAAHARQNFHPTEAVIGARTGGKYIVICAAIDHAAREEIALQHQLCRGRQNYHERLHEKRTIS
jgi:hypothetical protein